jgi:hypothetical protein
MQAQFRLTVDRLAAKRGFLCAPYEDILLNWQLLILGKYV